MAIFGDLSDLPLFEVFRVVRGSSGRLSVKEALGRSYQLLIEGGQLREFVVQDRSQHDLEQVKVYLQRLRLLKTGSFEFVKLTSLPPGPLSLPLETLESWLMWGSSGPSEQSEIARLVNALPHPETRMVYSLNRGSAAKEALNRFYSSLGGAFSQVLVALEKGMSATDLAQLNMLPLEHCQLSLYRLLEVGAVEPLRAFKVESSSASPQDNLQGNLQGSPQVKQVKPGFFSRLLGALRLREVK